MLYYAVKDKNIVYLDGFTQTTCLAQFMLGLADAARAHNRDKRRQACDTHGNPRYDKRGQGIMEFFDDGDADKPSCYTGIPGYIFNMVRHTAHPLLDFFIAEGVEAESAVPTNL